MASTANGPAAGVRPLLLLELNEVPWRLVDRAIESASGSARYPSLAQFFRSARTFTTQSFDQGELSPWVTWPSFHRGMPNTEHGIANLGQDVATFRGVPLWEEYRRRGLTVGVCGSLQSWPPRDPGPGGFYIPDTFAHDAACIPQHLEPLQRFNLAMVAKNGLVVRDEPLPRNELVALVPSLLRAGIRPRTYARVLAQLLSERVDRSRLARRPAFQAALFWDVFLKLYSADTPPALATFFTNHVASVMHRYWADYFPEDFPGRRPGPHAETMHFALQLADAMFADALRLQARNPEIVLVVASSMGQGPVHRDGHEGFHVSVVDVPALMGAMGVDAGSFTPLLAMVPQISVEIASTTVRAKLVDALRNARTASGAEPFDVSEKGASLTITAHTPTKRDWDAGGFYAHASDADARVGRGGTLVPWERAGIRAFPMDAGTAYHVPEGILAWRGRDISAADTREPVAAHHVKSMLMELAGLDGVRNSSRDAA